VLPRPTSQVSRTARTRHATFAAIALAFAVALASGCAEPEASAQPNAPQEVASEGYATSSACQSCHPSQYASWRESYHRTMTQTASPETIFGDFNDTTATGRGHELKMSRRGDRFFARVPEPAWDGKGTPDYEEREIVLVTGRHHMQIYWFESGHSRSLQRLPVAWDMADERWFPTDHNFIAPPQHMDGASGKPLPLEMAEWNNGCIECHVTDGRPRWGGPDKSFTEASEFGIACEACHGPAQAHAERLRDPSQRYAEHLAEAPVDDVVNPVELPFDRKSQVCGRCHSVFRFASNEHYAKYLTDRLSFEPGQDLLEVGFRVLKSEEAVPGSFWPDGEVKPSGREYNGLIDSPCYAAGELSCYSCHQMHAPTADVGALAAWRDDQLKPGMRGNEACLQCHDEYRDSATLGAHTHHLAESSGSECQNCHMPYTNLGLRKAVRSHTIANPNVSVDQATGRPNACNVCHVDQTTAWTARALESWYGQPQPSFDDIDRAVPASVIDLLRGDAAQRALAAAALGWPDAMKASGSGAWATPLLATLIEDPYPAVRYHARRALLRQPGFADSDFDFVGPAAERRAAANDFARRWASRRVQEKLRPDLRGILVRDPEANEHFDPAIFAKLRAERDDRPVLVRE
jgi:hypothetical protein